MSELTALLLSDGRPGHYHLAEGVIAAVARRRPVRTSRLEIKRRRLAPGRLLAAMIENGSKPAGILKLGYGIDARALPAADFVVSAGGETVAANVAAAGVLGAANIYCGTLKRVAPENMSLVVTSYAAHVGLPNHVVTLKPNGIDPDSFPGGAGAGRFGPDRPPRIAGLLVGGNSGLFRYDAGEWQTLLAFLRDQHSAQATRWIVSTSRRSSGAVGDAIAALAAEDAGPIAEFIDFREAGPGTLPGLFAKAEAILCTADSSTMISEAVCARRPVVAVAPVHHDFKRDEREYRAFMRSNGWCRFMALAELDPGRFVAALAEITPLKENHLDRLADLLTERLPGLFGHGP